MAVNAATLINFGGDLSVGDWLYSVVPRNVPAYLPLTNNDVSYLQSSYPALNAVLASNNKFTYTVTYPPSTLPFTAQNQFFGISGNGVFVAVPIQEYYSSGSNYAILVNNGASSNWSSAYYYPGAFISYSFFSIGYGNNVFAVVGATSAGSAGINVMYFASKPTLQTGGAWTVKTLPDTLYWVSIAYDSNTNVWVAVPHGYQGIANTARSTDGLATWTRGGTMKGPSNSGKTLIAGNSTFVALPYSNNSNGYYSVDGGVTWANTTFPKPENWVSGAYGNGRFVAVASNATSTTAASSTNGITWTSLVVPDLGMVGSRQLNNVSYGNGVWCVTSSIGANSTSVYSTHAFSSDLLYWTTATIPNIITTDTNIYTAFEYGANNEWFGVSKGSGVRVIATVNTTSFNLPLVTTQWGAIPYIKAS